MRSDSRVSLKNIEWKEKESLLSRGAKILPSLTSPSPFSFHQIMSTSFVSYKCY